MTTQTRTFESLTYAADLFNWAKIDTSVTPSRLVEEVLSTTGLTDREIVQTLRTIFYNETFKPNDNFK